MNWVPIVMDEWHEKDKTTNDLMDDIFWKIYNIRI